MITLTNYTEYRKYFEDLTAEAMFLDFFAYTKQEFDKSGSKDRNGWCLVLEPYTSMVKDNGADSILAYKKAMLVIVRKKTNELKAWEIEDQAEILAHKIIGRMRRDRKEIKLRTPMENFSIDPIEPMAAAGYFGVMLQFDFYHPINSTMKYEEDDWH